MKKTPQLREERFKELFPKAPSFRWKQIEDGFFDDSVNGWDELSTLPKDMREGLKALPWLSYTAEKVFMSKKRDTYKALLMLADGLEVETVLMENQRGQWTICVSSQVGCAMGCTFCATGKMGLIRSLSADEIIDQYRFWKLFLKKNPDIPERISNVVFMGMGEPLANYKNVRKTIQTWLKHTDLGHTKITVSTVGVLPSLKMLISDPEWPHVRLAISLHSADKETRMKIVPSSFEGFLDQLRDWCRTYLEQSGNRKHHITFEYVMLQDVNDTKMHAEKLVEFSESIGHVKINLIPYNFTDLGFQRSIHDSTARFKKILENSGITTTVRKTMGDDIAAACGQLITEKGAKG